MCSPSIYLPIAERAVAEGLVKGSTWPAMTSHTAAPGVQTVLASRDACSASSPRIQARSRTESRASLRYRHSHGTLSRTHQQKQQQHHQCVQLTSRSWALAALIPEKESDARTTSAEPEAVATSGASVTRDGPAATNGAHSGVDEASNGSSVSTNGTAKASAATNGAPSQGLAPSQASSLSTEPEAEEADEGWQRRWTIVGLCFFAFLLCNMDRVSAHTAESWTV